MRVGKWLFLFLSIAAVYGSDNKDSGRFTAGPASSYAAKQTIDKVTIGIDPYDTEAKAKTAFGKANPYSIGVLPVLLVMQNDSGQALDLSRMKVEFVTRDGRHIEATPARDVRTTKGPKRPNVAGGDSTPQIPIPIPRGAKKSKLDTWEIEGRAFSVRMVPAGESANGFFYFQTDSRAGTSIYVTGIRQAGTGKELFYYEIPMQ